MNQTTPVYRGQKQDLQLVFQLAWGPEGTAWGRFLSTAITFSVAFRVISNAITFLAIISQKAMRHSKEHLLMAYMSLFDFIDGNWFFCTVALDYGTRTRINCLYTFRHSLWYLIGGQASTSMLTMISVDRLIAASKPIWYWKQGISMTYKMLSVVIAWTLSFDILLLYYPFTYPDDLIPYCFTSHVFMDGFDLDGISRRIFLVSSIIIYSTVIIVYKRYMQKKLNAVMPTAVRYGQRQWLKYKKNLRKVTITLGISATITFFLYIVPYSVWHWMRKAYPSLQQYGWILFGVINWSSVLNLFLFSYRHREVKKAVWALFTWKTLPGNMDLWFPVVKSMEQPAQAFPMRTLTRHQSAHQGEQQNVQHC